MRLIVMRHAKSSWKTGGEDHERPLNKRGRADAPRIAEELARLGWTPSVVLSSDAQRTRETWELMAPVLDAPQRLEFLSQLYLAGIEQIRACCADVSGEGPVLVLGHNPGWEDAASWLSGEPVGMTTANAALLEHEGDAWDDAFALPGAWTLVKLVRPKEL